MQYLTDSPICLCAGKCLSSVCLLVNIVHVAVDQTFDRAAEGAQEQVTDVELGSASSAEAESASARGMTLHEPVKVNYLSSVN